MILIDSGSLHNFIDTIIENKLNMFVYLASKFQVAIVRNKITSYNGKCHKLKLSINDYQLNSPLYPKYIIGMDVVLVSQWLEMIGMLGLNLQK